MIEKFEITKDFRFQLTKTPTKKIRHVYLVNSYGSIIETFEHFDNKTGIINFVSTYDCILHFNSDIFAKFVDTSSSCTPVCCYTFMIIYDVSDTEAIDVTEDSTKFERVVHNVYREIKNDTGNMSMFDVIKIVQDQFKTVKSWDENVDVDKGKNI